MFHSIGFNLKEGLQNSLIHRSKQKIWTQITFMFSRVRSMKKNLARIWQLNLDVKSCLTQFKLGWNNILFSFWYLSLKNPFCFIKWKEFAYLMKCCQQQFFNNSWYAWDESTLHFLKRNKASFNHYRKAVTDRAYSGRFFKNLCDPEEMRNLFLRQATVNRPRVA